MIYLRCPVGCSGDEECTAHHSCVEQAANHLCFFTSRKDQHKLTPETKDVLQHRVNPNIGEGARSTVEALLYTPGSQWHAYNQRYEIMTLSTLAYKILK